MKETALPMEDLLRLPQLLAARDRLELSILVMVLFGAVECIAANRLDAPGLSQTMPYLLANLIAFYLLWASGRPTISSVLMSTVMFALWMLGAQNVSLYMRVLLAPQTLSEVTVH
jgi:hypothetical protein